MDPGMQPDSPRSVANIFSKTFFCWVIPLLKKGSKIDLETSDVYKVSAENSSSHLREKLSKAWEQEINLHPKQPSLLRCLRKVFGWRWMGLGVIFFLKECVFKIAQALLLGMLLRYFSTPMTESTACILAGLLILSTASYYLLNTPYNFYSGYLGMQIKIACSNLIYIKALSLSQDSLKTTTSGKLINLLSNDMKRFDTGYFFSLIHSIWVGPLMTCAVMVILWYQIGISTTVGIAFFGIFMPCQGMLGYIAGNLRAEAAKRTDVRLQLTNEVMSGIKLIKMCAWEFIFLDKIKKVRGKELEMLRKKMYISATQMGLDGLATRLIILLTFSVYVMLNGWLSPEKVYVTLFLYNSTRELMTRQFPLSVSVSAEMFVAIRRIQTVLLLPEKKLNETYKEKNEDGSNNSIKIEFDNVSCSWDKSRQQMALQEMTFQVESNQLLAIVGPVGSGKSSLFEAILDELPLASGNKNVQGRTVFVAQVPWVFNGTLRENIVFGQPMDESWYQTVLEACALKEDISKFPEGDLSIVGEKGVALSEGQKARVNLARAVFANGDIYLLDDPLSAVDARVGRHLYEKCIRGVLKSKCVVLITHHVNYLENADEILVLGNGRIQHRGTYQELTLTDPSIFSAMFKDTDEQIEMLERKISSSGSDYSDPEELNRVLETDFDGIEEDGLVAITSETTPLLTYGTFQSVRHQEVQTKGLVGLGLIWPYLRAGNSVALIFILIGLNVASQAFLSSSDYYLQLWTNSEDPKSAKTWMDIRAQNRYQWTFTALVILMGFTYFCNIFLYVGMITKSGLALHNSMAKSFIRAQMKIFELNPLGRILNRFGRDMGAIDEDIPVRLFITTGKICLVTGSVALVCVMSPPMIIPSFILFILLYWIRKFYLRTSSSVKRLEGIARSPIYSHISTTINGIRTIRAFGVEKTFIAQYDREQDVHTSLWYMYLALSSWLSMTFEWLTVLYTITVVFIFILFDKNGSEVGLALTTVLTLSQHISQGMQLSTDLENELVAVERVVEYGHLESEAPLDTEPPGKKPDEGWPYQGEIQMDNVCVKYDESSARFALQNITFVAKPKEKIGIVGRTGAGKSSLMATLLRLIEPCAGSIEIDDVDILTLGLHDIRRKIFVIPQNPSFFVGTLRENLDVEKKYKDEELWNALESVQLTKRLTNENESQGLISQALDTQVGDGGSRFSVGERQLICFARAILSQSRIVILDEATANVDNVTDAVMQSLIRKAFQDSTVLIIAHRLHTVMECDRLCVMDSGTIVEFDEPYILLQNPNGYLSQLINQGGESSAANLLQLAADAHTKRQMND